MKLFHLFVVASLASSYTIGSFQTDSVLDSTTGVTPADCRFQTTQDVAFVCRRCEAANAYKLGTATAFSVQGMLRSVRDKVLEILQDTSRILPAANVTFSTTNDRFCLYLDGFASEPDYVAMLAGFTSFPNAPLQMLENFPVQAVYARYVGLEARQGSGSGHYYRYMESAYTVGVARRASPTLTLNMDSFTVRFEYTGAFVTYVGQAIYDGASTPIPFTVVVPYNRPAFEDYTMHLAVRSQYRLGPMADLIAPSYTCSSTMDLPGIPDMRQLPVLMADIPFIRDEATGRMNFNDVVLHFFIPPFAIAPNVFLDTPTGSVRIRGLSQDCAVAIDSTWRRTDIPTMDFHIDQRLDLPLTARASLSYEPRVMTIENIASYFYTQMYPDPFNIYPLYVNSKVELGDTISLIQVLEPQFRLVFTPEAVITVTGVASYLTDQDTTVSIGIGRENGALESLVQIEVNSAEMLTRLLGASPSPMTGFQLIVNRIVSSSVALGLSEDSPLRPENVEVGVTNAGFSSILDLTYGDECSRSEFCTLLQLVTGGTSLSLSSRFVPDYFLMSSALPNITLAGRLQFYNSVMRMYFGPPSTESWVEGLMNIQGDSKSLLSFRANMTNTNGDIRLTAAMRGQWTQALDLPSLTLQGLLLTADLNGNGDIVDSTIRGIATFGDCTDTACWFGDATVSLSLVDYLENFVVIVMRPAEPEVVFGRLMGQDTLSPLLRELRFPADITVTYAYREQGRYPAGLTTTTQARFLGIPTLLTSNGADTTITSMQIFLQLPFFTLGSSNIQVAGSYNSAVSARLDFSRVTGVTTGLIVGTVTLWGISQVTDLQLTDSDVSFTLSGYPFGGVYYMDLSVKGPLTDDITTAAFTVSGSIDSDSTSNLERLITQSLSRWAQQGTDTIRRINEFLARQQDLIDTYQSQLCTTDCPMVTECVGEPQYVCTQNPVLETCVGTKQGCRNVVVTCDSTLSTCMQTEATCAVYDTQVLGGNCLQWETTCVNSIDTCQNWSQECAETVEQGCGLIQDTVMEDTCLREELLCEERTMQDPTCAMRCNNVQALRDEAQRTYDVYQSTLEQSQAAFGGLSELQEPGVSLFRVRLTQIESISFNRPMDEPGLGPSDLLMKVVFMVPSLQNEKMVAYSVQTKWNFFTEVENQVRLARLAREQIVNSSQGRLANSIIDESPVEIFETLLRETWNQQ